MTEHNIIHVSIPLPPREVRNLSQRLQAADEAWQDFMALYNVCGAEGKGSGYLPLTAFARFLHELVPNPELCAPLMHDFETRQLQAGGQRQGSYQ